MYDNTPIKPKRKKLRNKHIITIDPQILRWRKLRNKLSVISTPNTPHNAQECPPLNDQSALSTLVATPLSYDDLMKKLGIK